MNTPNSTTDQIRYQPGDVANGHVLGVDGTTWEPIGQVQVPAQPDKKKRRWLKWAFIGAGGFLAFAMVVSALGGGSSSDDAVADAEAAAEAAIAEAEAEAEEAVAEAEAAAAEAQAEADAAAAEAEAAAQAEPEADATAGDPGTASGTDPADSFSTQAFLTDARNNLGDLRKDVSDAQSALAEGRTLGLSWNFAEIAFNSGQLGVLTPPQTIAGDWNAAIVELNAGLDAATLGLENDSISEMDSGLARVSAAADTLAGLVDRI